MQSAKEAAGSPLGRLTAWLRAHEITAVIVTGLLLGVVFCARLWRAQPITLTWDWDYTLLSQTLGRDAVRRFGEVPLYTPYVCGGMPFFANPQTRFFTPMFLLHLAFGADAAIRLELALHIALAFVGAYYLARRVGLGAAASAVSAFAFPTCSWHFSHFAVGHAATALPLAYLPWPLALALHALASGRWSLAALAGAVIAVMFGEGGAYATAYALLTLGMVLGGLALLKRSTRPLLVLGLAGVFTLAFGAVKFLPTAELMRVNARHTVHPDGFFPLLILRAIFSRNQDLLQRHPYQHWGWHEYGAYVPPLFLLLAVAAIVFDRRRSNLYGVCLLASVALAVGDLFTIWEAHPRPLESPWSLLHRIPPFNSLRAPSRLLIVAVFFGGILSGFGVEALFRRYGERARRAVLVLLGIAVLDAWVVGTRNLEYVFWPPAPPEAAPARPAGPFAQFVDTSPSLMLEEGGASRRMGAIVAQDRGVLNCYEPIKPARAALGPGEAGYRGEYYVLGAGSARLVHWSPLAQRYDVALPSPTTLVLNQNYFDDFRLVEGNGNVVSEHGLVGVTLPAGTQTITVAYRCAGFWLGLVVTLVAAGATLVLALRERSSLHSPERWHSLPFV